MTTQDYSATITLRPKPSWWISDPGATAGYLTTSYGSFHPVVGGPDERGAFDVRITLPAHSRQQADEVASALATRLSGSFTLYGLEVQTTKSFDREALA